ncbi:hypothetical protein [Streptomyces sp. NPDC048442]|uniref:hypothetical protein n=1 Tax=Streptomyces sp. NPDC048442 TaxID=3154823 RepID=UPI00341ACBB3
MSSAASYERGVVRGTRSCDEFGDEDGYGIPAPGVGTVVEVVASGRQHIQRDRIHKRREYARAGIAVYALVDDFDGDGSVVVLTSPDPKADTGA